MVMGGSEVIRVRVGGGGVGGGWGWWGVTERGESVPSQTQW